MTKTLYHAGPSGLTTLRTSRELIDEGVMSVEEYAEAWESKWGDRVLDPWSLMAHPALDEICFFDNFEDAEQLAQKIGGCVYVADIDTELIVSNNEGVPSVRGIEIEVKVAA